MLRGTFPVWPRPVEDWRAAFATEAAFVATWRLVILDQMLALHPAEISLICARARLRNGAACCFRHREQWQLRGHESGPVISNFTSSHRQLPRTVHTMLMSITLCEVFTIPQQGPGAPYSSTKGESTVGGQSLRVSGMSQDGRPPPQP